MNRKLFYILNFLVLGLFIAALIQDENREWKKYQGEFFRMEVERLKADLAKASDEAERENLRAQIASHKWRWPKIKQVMSQDLERYDRCVTCHVGVDPLANPKLTTPYDEHPYKLAAVPAHAQHDLTKLACTSCHAGQGLATTVEAAHGELAHWEEPMLKAPYIQASCAKCHGDFRTLAGAETVKRGREIFEDQGCIGCHSVRGWGGEISVDLGDIADKPVSRIDWSNTGPLPHDQWNVKNWIELHFTKDTMDLVPGDPEGHMCTPGQPCEPISPSGMPPFVEWLSREDAAAITTYMLSMTDRPIPAKFLVPDSSAPPKAPSDPVARGKLVFKKYGCAGCHGVGGAEGRRNFNARGENQKGMKDGREPTLVDVVGTYTREELKEKIRDGVKSTVIAKFNPEGPTPPLYMPAWKAKIKGQEEEDLITYLLSIAKQDEGW